MHPFMRAIVIFHLLIFRVHLHDLTTFNKPKYHMYTLGDHYFFLYSRTCGSVYASLLQGYQQLKEI